MAKKQIALQDYSVDQVRLGPLKDKKPSERQVPVPTQYPEPLDILENSPEPQHALIDLGVNQTPRWDETMQALVPPSRTPSPLLVYLHEGRPGDLAHAEKGMSRRRLWVMYKDPGQAEDRRRLRTLFEDSSEKTEVAGPKH